ncbi:Glycine betaine transporter BetL [compost metagenome]
MGNIIAFIATLLIITFFFTSADSATFVLGMLSTKGNPNPSNKVKIVWGVLQSSIAIVLLISGGLSGLQTASIVAALPFAIIIIGMCVSLIVSLRQEERTLRGREQKRMKKIDELLMESES